MSASAAKMCVAGKAVRNELLALDKDGQGEVQWQLSQQSSSTVAREAFSQATMGLFSYAIACQKARR
jgi:hypothetical protein